MNHRWSAVVIGSLLALAPAALFSASDAKAPAKDVKECSCKTDKWQKKLNLSDDQKAKLKDLRKSEKDTVKPLREKQRDLAKKLKTQLKDKASDADIQATLDEMKAGRKAIQAQMEQFQSQRDAILTPTQRAQMQLKMMKHGHGMWPHGDKSGDKNGSPTKE